MRRHLGRYETTGGELPPSLLGQTVGEAAAGVYWRPGPNLMVSTVQISGGIVMMAALRSYRNKVIGYRRKDTPILTASASGRAAGTATASRTIRPRRRSLRDRRCRAYRPRRLGVAFQRTERLGAVRALNPLGVARGVTHPRCRRSL